MVYNINIINMSEFDIFTQFPNSTNDLLEMFDWKENRTLPFRVPNAKETTLAEQVLISVSGIQSRLRNGAILTMDLYTSPNILAKYHICQNPLLTNESTIARKTHAFFKKRRADSNVCTHIFSSSLSHLLQTALESEETMQAFRAIWHAITNNQRIAFVASHGGRDNRASEPHEWRLTNGLATKTVPVTDIVMGLANEKGINGSTKYGLVYCNACNPHSNALHGLENHNHIPIIVHTATHTDAYAPAKVY